jgi:hypothetical protein
VLPEGKLQSVTASLHQIMQYSGWTAIGLLSLELASMVLGWGR